MVLGLSQLLEPLRPVGAAQAPAGQPAVDAAVAAVIRKLEEAFSTGPAAVPVCVVDELRAALKEEAAHGEEHLRSSATFVAHHLARARVQHTAAEATPIAMEALRIEGLKAIKKWRAWQAFKSAHRIDALAAFMYAKPDMGTLVLELPTLVPDEPVLPATKRRALTEAVSRLRECLEELGPGDDEEREAVAFEIVMCFEKLTETETEEPLVQFGAALCYAMERVRAAPMPETWDRWAEHVLGSREDYAEWRAARADRRRAAAARASLAAAGRAPVPELDILRPRDSQCQRCSGQTYLVEEHIRRSDEPSDWFRLCPVCNTVTRPKG
jgi:hypothetical protein